jgi:hypothetical protein
MFNYDAMTELEGSEQFHYNKVEQKLELRSSFSYHFLKSLLFECGHTYKFN